jgi:hypothetical protein
MLTFHLQYEDSTVLQNFKAKYNMVDHLLYARGSEYFLSFIAEEYMKIDQAYFLPHPSQFISSFDAIYCEI